MACAYWARAAPRPMSVAWAVSKATRAVITAEGGQLVGLEFDSDRRQCAAA
jgi:hypothetical protein